MSSVPQSSLPTRAFLLTISTKGDVSDECVEAVVKHIEKTTDHAYVVTEHGESGKRHLHAVMLYKTPRTPKKLQDNVWQRFVKPYHPDSVGRVCVKVQVCPGNTWYDEYLRKEADVTVHYDTYDRETACEYFPSQAIQEALQATKKHVGIACPWLEQDVSTWSGSTFANTSEGALQYLKHRMFVAKNMVPITDKRKLVEKAVMYFEYRNGVISPSPKELMLLHQAEMSDPYIGPTGIWAQQTAANPGI